MPVFVVVSGNRLTIQFGGLTTENRGLRFEVQALDDDEDDSSCEMYLRLSEGRFKPPCLAISDFCMMYFDTHIYTVIYPALRSYSPILLRALSLSIYP